jgi:hypothetical protein
VGGLSSRPNVNCKLAQQGDQLALQGAQLAWQGAQLAWQGVNWRCKVLNSRAKSSSRRTAQPTHFVGTPVPATLRARPPHTVEG